MQRFRAHIMSLARGGAILIGMLPGRAMAGGTGMPWEAPLEGIVDSLTGPVANAAAIIAVTIFGLTLAFGSGGGGMRTAIGVLFGLSIAFAAASFFPAFFGFEGGALIP